MIDGRKVINGLLFFNELDLLELRVRELAPIVDTFLVVQSPQTHAGEPKEIAFDPADPRWEPWRAQLMGVVIPPLPNGVGRWVRENAPRHAMESMLQDEDPDALFLLSDADEIPRALDVLEAVPRLTDGLWVGFRPKLYHYYLNLRTPFFWSAISLSTVATARRIGVQELRNLRKAPPLTVPRNTGGWHFSWLGGVAAIQEKIRSYCHTEFNTPTILDADRLQRCIDEWRDPFDRFTNKKEKYYQYRFHEAPLSELPAAVAEDPARWAHLLLPRTTP